MLVFVDANLVLFAIPKTGSTAYHLALRGKADISLINKPFLKHMSMRKYEADFAPFLQKAYGLAPARVAVMRDPLEQLRSWYRYRQKPKSRAKAGQHAALGLSFDEFVQETLKERPQPMARVGSQYDFLCGADGTLAVDHLFAYEKPLVLCDFLQSQLGSAVAAKQHNVSPPADTRISPETEAQLRQARAADFALHAQVMQAGGHWQRAGAGG